MSGLSERYVPDDEEEEPDPPSPAARAPSPPTPTGDVDGWDGGFAADVQAQDPRSGVRCVASERRIRPVVEPPASELVDVDPRYVLSRSKRVLHRAAYDAYQRLKAAAEAAGLPANLLKIISGYRSVAQQRRLWAEALKKYGSPQAARRWVAPPGGSPHHTGRAIDFFMGTRNSSGNIPALRATQAYAWLVCNASRFGFFPYANEPWHWEFNPGGGNGASGRTARERPSRQMPLSGARLAETPERGPILAALGPLAGPDVPPTVANALSLVKLISAYHGLPWRVGYTILEHEGGVRRFRHGDGVMQTTRSARNGTIPRIPRELKLVLLGRPASDPAPDTELNAVLEAEFPRRLAVQIATGIQELKTNLDRFGGYVSLALAAYNTGSGNVYGMVTGGQTRRPRGVTDAQWEDMCRRAATLYHQPAAGIRVAVGVWQCDANMPGWFKHFAVFDRGSGRQLRGFKYLRSFTGCIPGQQPGTACTWAVHGRAHRQPGSGAQVCKPSRFGSLDKLYDARYLDAPYRRAAGAELTPIPDDGRPLKATGGQLVKTPVSPMPAGH